MTEKVQTVHYVAFYQPDVGQPYFRRATLTLPDGMIPPPEIRLAIPLDGVHPLTYVGGGTQTEIAHLFGLHQQSVGRWLKNPVPDR